MLVVHAHDCVTLLALLAAASLAAGQPDVRVREFTPSDEYDRDLVKRLSGLAGLPRRHGHWPRLWDETHPWTKDAGIQLLAEVDGLIVGRVFLEAHHHPYCELVNLSVRPDYEGQGVATALVRDAITRARGLGFKVMVLQEDSGGGPAHGIYEMAGFVPATRGAMLRMVKPLDVPLVSALLKRTPDAAFASDAAPERGDRWWRLSWRATPDDFASLYLHGGSSQFDSDGFQPVIQGCDFAAGSTGLAAEAEAAPDVTRDRPQNPIASARGAVDVLVTVGNRGDQAFQGVVRAMLLPDTEVDGPASLQALSIELAPGETQTLTLPIRITHQFRCDLLRFGSYPSVPLTVEIAWERGSMLLSAAVKVT